MRSIGSGNPVFVDHKRRGGGDSWGCQCKDGARIGGTCKRRVVTSVDARLKKWSMFACEVGMRVGMPSNSEEEVSVDERRRSSGSIVAQFEVMGDGRGRREK